MGLKFLNSELQMFCVMNCKKINKCIGNQQCNRHLYFPGEHYNFQGFFQTYPYLWSFSRLSKTLFHDFPYFSRICTNPGHSRKSYAAHTIHCSMCYRHRLIGDEIFTPREWNLSCCRMQFYVAAICSVNLFVLRPWPDDLHIWTWPVLPGDILDVKIWTSYVKPFESYRLTGKHTYIQTDRHDRNYIPRHFADKNRPYSLKKSATYKNPVRTCTAHNSIVLYYCPLKPAQHLL